MHIMESTVQGHMIIVIYVMHTLRYTKICPAFYYVVLSINYHFSYHSHTPLPTPPHPFFALPRARREEQLTALDLEVSAELAR